MQPRKIRLQGGGANPLGLDASRFAHFKLHIAGSIFFQ
jgi:hypothetical protein